MSIIVYGRHTSYNVQKVLWLLEELQLTYKHIELGHNDGDTETDEFGKLNPMRKVPVLVDDDRVIWESNTILRYLSNESGQGKWHIEGAYQRSLIERWMDWSQTVFEPAFVDVFWGYYRTPKALRNEDQIGEGLSVCRDCLCKIGAQLGKHSYLAGDFLSLADVCTGVFIYRLVEIDLGVELPQSVSIWYRKLKQRDGYQRWAMSDFSSLRGAVAVLIGDVAIRFSSEPIHPTYKSLKQPDHPLASSS